MTVTLIQNATLGPGDELRYTCNEHGRGGALGFADLAMFHFDVGLILLAIRAQYQKY